MKKSVKRKDLSWDGFDYTTNTKVNRTRKEWRDIIKVATYKTRADGDLLIFHKGVLVAEIYDKD